jgi:hypothetical protein
MNSTPKGGTGDAAVVEQGDDGVEKWPHFYFKN